jgi:glycogen synthase
MTDKLPRILMLGWEFPPLINGGLGVACHNLSSAMSGMADITMVVPKSVPGYMLNDVKLIGINNLNAASFNNYPSNYHKPFPFKIFNVPVQLDPYYSENIFNSDFQNANGSASKIQSGHFNIDNLYGGDVISKVFKYAEITAALAADMEFDVIHAHDWMTMVAGMMIKHRSGKPLVMHVHSLEVDRSGEASKGWVYQLEKEGMQYADLLMPVSNFTADNIQKHYGISPEKIKTVYNGSVQVKAYRTKKNYKEKTVLFVGRVTRQKGPEKFLEIAAKVLQKRDGVRFIMAGTGDNYRKCIEQSSYKGIGSRFHMTGFLNEQKLSHLFSISDIYCMPSVSEPFGLSAVEAAQFGIPCVISKQSGVAEVLKGALKFDFWDINKASGYILNLLADDGLRQKVAEDAARDLKNINWQTAANQVIHFYKQHRLIPN